jgi:hypothetical protein
MEITKASRIMAQGTRIDQATGEFTNPNCLFNHLPTELLIRIATHVSEPGINTTKIIEDTALNQFGRPPFAKK